MEKQFWINNPMHLLRLILMVASIFGLTTTTFAKTPAEKMLEPPKRVYVVKRPLPIVERCMVLTGLPVTPYRTADNENESIIINHPRTNDLRAVWILSYKNLQTTLSIYDGVALVMPDLEKCFED